ncbi:MFS general substrate transporter [Thozetella sp. PMI_491]|nr:MFS general substrate transporter [Thozetella sp. PMI_491]
MKAPEVKDPHSSSSDEFALEIEPASPPTPPGPEKAGLEPIEKTPSSTSSATSDTTSTTEPPDPLAWTDPIARQRSRQGVIEKDEFEPYNKFSKHRKIVIVSYLSYASLLSPISSTSVLSATPEVAEEYGTTGTVLNIIVALYLCFMGLAPLIWGPVSQVYGRRPTALITSVLFLLCSIGTALAPNLAAFTVFRLLSAIPGTSFLIVGSACVGDIFHPTGRATALGWLASGTLVGPALGPFIGGVIVTYTSWRVIFWLQTGLTGLACLGGFFLLPETIHRKKARDMADMSRAQRARVIWKMLQPWNVLRHFKYPNMIFAAAASSSLVWNMYALLTPIRYVLNPRFNLSTPMEGGFFYLAPGVGYLVGTFLGGRYADYVVKKYIKKRGVRVPEDRLRSAVPFLGVIIPVSVLVYGWAVETEKGGIAVPVIMMFVQGVAQLMCFPSINTYLLDVMQEDGAEVIAGNYVVRYIFGSIGAAVSLPSVQGIGVGGSCTIAAGFMAASAGGLVLVIRYGPGWMVKLKDSK